MCEYDRVTLQRAISKAYRDSEYCVSDAMQKLDAMVDTLETLDPSDSDELHTGAHLVIEDFSDESSAA